MLSRNLGRKCACHLDSLNQRDWTWYCIQVIEEALDRVLVGFGTELLGIIPGVVSTEIPADLSFDQKGKDSTGSTLGFRFMLTGTAAESCPI